MPISRTTEEIIADLDQRIAEFEERKKLELEKGRKRDKLLAYAREHGYVRADLSWVLNQLELQVITTKHRVANARKGTQGKPRNPDNVLHPKFARTITKAREAKGLTTNELADKIKRHVSTIHMYERGAGMPSKALVPKLMEILDLPEAAFKRG